ncbi:MAG: hypothetical protein QOE88_2093 [Verrucomicrobiota bacterium]|nr:hypothetical protein [Verrucomicrobiota bacterium]
MIFVISVSLCVKFRSEKDNPHGDRRERKEKRVRESKRVIPSESVLVIFAISVCKFPIRKDNPHRDRKERKEKRVRESTRVIQSESVLVIFVISVCKISIPDGYARGNPPKESLLSQTQVDFFEFFELGCQVEFFLDCLRGIFSQGLSKMIVCRQTL